MDNDKIICRVCGEENEPEYEFCKNCGSPMRSETGSENKPPYNSNYSEQSTGGRQSYEYKPEAQEYYVDSIDGIPFEEMAVFIGRKAPQFVTKFTKMRLGNTKAVWCWPAAILSFLFGPLGAAIWFFYRKMYKTALYFAAAGTILTIVLNFFISTDMASLNELFKNSNLLLNEAIKDVNWFAQIDNAINIATAVITGLFSAYWYKNFAVKRILDYRVNGADPRYYRVGLSVIGGTSDGMAILGVIIMLAANSFSMFLVNNIIK